MSPEVQTAVISGVFSVLAGAIALLGRGRFRTKSAQTVRRSANRQEALETYAFTLRRQILSLGRKPKRWPDLLRYLQADDPDDGDDDDDT